MLWALYNVVFAVAYVLLLPRFLRRMWRRGGYRRGFGQRLGFYGRAARPGPAPGGRIWVHAVSVGEIYVALRFIRSCRERKPGLVFCVTTTTSTGHAIASAHLDPRDTLLYFPVDFPFCVRRALDYIRPDAIVLTECELWPNLIRLAHADGVPVTLINGRISASSFRGYRLLRPLFRRVAARLTLLCVQEAEDAARLRALGTPGGLIHVMGSVKYDMHADETAGRRDYIEGLLSAAGIGPGQRVLLGGSTWPGEEAALLRAFQRLRPERPDLRLVLVPRHVERARELADELDRAGLPWLLRSALKADAGPAPPGRPEVLLVDTTGELADFYRHATVIFVGKSLTRHGGQNVIEPAALGKAVVTGPHMENFAAVMRDLAAAGAVVSVAGEEELCAALAGLLDDGERRATLGARALGVVQGKRGAVDATARLVIETALRGARPGG